MNSPLLQLEEENASLDAALAFLDTYDGLLPDLELSVELSADLMSAICSPEFESHSASPIAERRTGTTTNDNPVATDQIANALCVQEACEKAKPPKRKRAALSAGKRGHKEIAADLRQQATHLTARLAQLQKLCLTKRSPAGNAQRERHLASRRASLTTSIEAHSHTLANAKERSTAYQTAMLELQKLQESEKVNQKLKFAWRKEIKLAKKMETLARQIVALEAEPLLRAKSTDSNAIAVRDDLVAQTDHCVFNVTQLLNELVLLYYQAALVCDSLSFQDTSRVFSSSHMHHDRVLGQTFEFTTNTPVTCSLRELDALLMTYLASKQQQAKKQHGAIQEGKVSSSMCYENRYAQTMECQFGTILLDGVSVTRKFDEPHRHVFASTSKVALASTELTFQLDGWFIMTERRSTSSSSEAQALLQTFSRVHRDRTNSAPNTLALERDAYFQDFILVAKCEEMREKMLRLQSAVLEQLGAPQSSVTV